MSDYTKLITTRLKLDGEAEYNNKISQISKSMGGMKSEMSKLSAEYAGQLNSYEALTKKGDILTRQLDAQKVLPHLLLKGCLLFLPIRLRKSQFFAIDVILQNVCQ